MKGTKYLLQRQDERERKLVIGTYYSKESAENQKKFLLAIDDSYTYNIIEVVWGNEFGIDFRRKHETIPM